MLYIDPILGAARDGAVSLTEQQAGFNRATAAQKATFKTSVSGHNRTQGVWADRPASGAAGDEYLATDLGTAGVLFRWSASLGLWRLAHDCLLYVRDASVVGTTGGAVQVLAQAPIPAGLLTSVARWSFQHVLSKSGATDACTNISIRLGTAGASPDALIVSLANPMTAANRSFASETMLRRITDTSVASAGNGTQLTSFSGGGSGGIIGSAVAVPDMSTTALTMSLSATMAGTTDIPTSHLVYLQGFAA